ncbi:MAG: GNAT family N-acetyltransferase [Aliishimia sp.]
MPFDTPPPDAFQKTASGTARLEQDAVVLNQGQQIAIKSIKDGVLGLGAPPQGLALLDLLAVFEVLSNHNAEEVLITLDTQAWSDYAPELLARGVAVAVQDGQLAVFPELLWQVPDLWLSEVAPACPQSLQVGPHGRFPLRPAKPTGALYHRYIPWLTQVFSLRALDPETDLDLFHTWMNDTRVAAFFDEAGGLDEHKAYLEKMAADPHMMPVIGALDGQPFCYFELYWAKENRIGAHYSAGNWDRGWHVLVGDESTRGADYITAWLPSLMHYMFLTEPRTQTLVGEPATNHTQQLRNLTRSGFSRVKDFDFPHKRATLVSLERDYFFKGRLWARPDPKDPGAPLRLSLSAQTQPGAAK